ncbi:unnamed protein product [Acanthosepion pharaonis]|uniref:Uncharacterized protein n=1 Tax=Acanthosepion pharaonis TaxID=158019 RepID=A0A812ASP2_ACAPH|nr:unnamed protein product [Sepia pharaonis]
MIPSPFLLSPVVPQPYPPTFFIPTHPLLVSLPFMTIPAAASPTPYRLALFPHRHRRLPSSVFLVVFLVFIFPLGFLFFMFSIFTSYFFFVSSRSDIRDFLRFDISHMNSRSFLEISYFVTFFFFFFLFLSVLLFLLFLFSYFPFFLSSFFFIFSFFSSFYFLFFFFLSKVFLLTFFLSFFLFLF